MKNPFHFYKASGDRSRLPYAPPAEPMVEPDLPRKKPEPHRETPPDDFVEWCRTRVQGGIERRERNDIYEAYSVFGTNPQGELLCRYYHRYPEHERDFDLSYTRSLNFNDFNRRLLAELDRGSLDLSAYHLCVQKAEQRSDNALSDVPAAGFSQAEAQSLRGFCEDLDTLKDKEYRSATGVFYCSCTSVVGDEALGIRFRRLLPHDAFGADVAGVSRTPIEGCDIDDLWIMSVYNRLREKSGSCTVTRLKSEWTLGGETVCLFTTADFPGVSGTLLIAAAAPAAMARFGFYSLDFSAK